MKTVVFLLFGLLSIPSYSQSPVSYGGTYKSHQLAKDKAGDYFVVNKKNEIVSRVDALHINTDEVIQQIKKSSITDKEIICRVLEMNKNETARMKEILALTHSYNDVSVILLKEIHKILSTKK